MYMKYGKKIQCCKCLKYFNRTKKHVQYEWLYLEVDALYCKYIN